MVIDAATIVAILAGLGGFVTAIVTASVSARKSQLDILQGIVNEVQDENHRLRERIIELECDLKSAREQINELLRENADLRAILRMAGMTIPVKMAGRAGKGPQITQTDAD